MGKKPRQNLKNEAKNETVFLVECAYCLQISFLVGYPIVLLIEKIYEA